MKHDYSMVCNKDDIGELEKFTITRHKVRPPLKTHAFLPPSSTPFPRLLTAFSLSHDISLSKDRTVSFKSHAGKTLNSTQGGRLICDVRALFMNVSKGTRFKVFEHGEGIVSFQSTFGKFICTDLASGATAANATAITDGAKFFAIGKGLQQAR
jgi:hypothetical protein